MRFHTTGAGYPVQVAQASGGSVGFHARRSPAGAENDAVKVQAHGKENTPAEGEIQSPLSIYMPPSENFSM